MCGWLSSAGRRRVFQLSLRHVQRCRVYSTGAALYNHIYLFIYLFSRVLTGGWCAQKRHVLEENNQLESRVSALDDDIEGMEEEEDDDDEEETSNAKVRAAHTSSRSFDRITSRKPSIV